MKPAQLIYEEAITGYRLKFPYGPVWDSKKWDDKRGRDIHTSLVIESLKKMIPANKRTYDPATHDWYIDESYFDIVKTLLEGSRKYTITIVTKAEVEELKRKQAEAQKQYGQMQRPHVTSIEDELTTFINLLKSVNVLNGTDPKDWSKNDAKKYYRRAAVQLHPDKGGDPIKMAELSKTWAILEQGYYIK